MKDKEIIKALECCAKYPRNCAECPLCVTSTEPCSVPLARGALDLINRQKAENSNLSSDLTSLKKDLTSARAEIERLKVDFESMRCIANGFKSAYEREKGARNIAIQDFAERVKDVYCVHEGLHCAIDNIAKEMLAEKCANNTPNCTEKCVTADYCIVCGKHIPEGRHICPLCESGGETK